MSYIADGSLIGFADDVFPAGRPQRISVFRSFILPVVVERFVIELFAIAAGVASQLVSNGTTLDEFPCERLVRL
jgi:hypothetical protein